MNPAFLIWILLTMITMSSTSTTETKETRYVAPTAQGTGDGTTAQNAASYTHAEFWRQVQSALADDPITVYFLKGNYTHGPLKLTGIGCPEHRLAIQGDPGGATVFRIDSTDEKNPDTGFYVSGGCQNITIRDLHFTGHGTVGYISNVRGSHHITFEQCSWIDLPHIIYGATGTAPGKAATPENATHADTHHITFEACTFKRVGTTGGAHMIYNAYGSQHVSVLNCDFEDCSGDYIRFRDLCDYCTVSGSTFKSTGDYPPDKPVRRPFVAIPLFSDVNPGDEWFGTHFLIANNTFTYESASTAEPGERIAIAFVHKGFDPPGRHHLLTPEEGAILETGTPQARQSLLKTNCGIETDQVHVFANRYTGVEIKAVYTCRAAYGALSKGWEKTADIFDLLNHHPISFENWMAVSQAQESGK